MAKSATFQIKNNTNVYIGTEATMGTPSVASAALVELPVTDYSFSELGAGGQSLNVAPFRVGGGLTQSDDMVKAQRHDRMYEVSVTFMCTNAATKRVLLNLYEDGSVSNDLSVLIGSMPSTLLFEHGQPNTVPVSLIFRDLGHDSTSDMVFKSCMATSLTFSGDIGSNGGVVMCTAVFQTAYKPIASTDLAYSSITTVSDQDTMFNMHDLSTTEITPSGGSAEDLLLYSFELNIARTVTRVGFDASTDFNPMGYALGGYEVTGSLNAKRDGESVTAIAEGNTSFALDLDTSVYQILAPTCFIDNASISFDDDGFKQVIPFRATYTGATTNTIFSFAGKTEDT